MRLCYLSRQESSHLFKSKIFIFIFFTFFNKSGSPITSSSYSKVSKTEESTPPPTKKAEEYTTHNSPNLALGRRVLNTPSPAKMPNMGPPPEHCKGKMCLALDLDETLVHSSFQPVDNASFIIEVTIEVIKLLLH